jgi:hypothetical protein
MLGQAINTILQAHNHMHRAFFCRRVRDFQYAGSGLYNYGYDLFLADMSKKKGIPAKKKGSTKHVLAGYSLSIKYKRIMKKF